MLMIRFLRAGKRNQPFFKIVVVDRKQSSKSGRFMEQVGFFNPLTKEKKLNAERIKLWISKGVKLSDTVSNLLIKEKIIEGKKISVHKKSKKEMPAPVTPKSEEPVKNELAPVKSEPVKEEPKKKEKPQERIDK